MENKLNGFNNGRDTTDGIGGKFNVIIVQPPNPILEERLYTKFELIQKLQDTAIHFGVTNTPKDDGTILDKINKWIIEQLNK